MPENMDDHGNFTTKNYEKSRFFRGICFRLNWQLEFQKKSAPQITILKLFGSSSEMTPTPCCNSNVAGRITFRLFATLPEISFRKSLDFTETFWRSPAHQKWPSLPSSDHLHIGDSPTTADAPGNLLRLESTVGASSGFQKAKD